MDVGPRTAGGVPAHQRHPVYFRYGIGGVLLQLHDGDWKPVANCSRRLTEAETRYAQIERVLSECLGM